MSALNIGLLATVTAVLLWNIRVIKSKLTAVVDTGSSQVEASEFQSLMELELQRARRLNYPLSIISLRTKNTGRTRPSPRDVLRLISFDSRYVGIKSPIPGVVNIFENSPDPAIRLRATDMAVYDKKRDRFVMMLVGTEREAAEKIAHRLSANLSTNLKCSVGIGCAEFPSDRYGVDDLIEFTEQEIAISRPSDADVQAAH